MWRAEDRPLGTIVCCNKIIIIIIIIIIIMLGRESSTPLALSYPLQPPPPDEEGYVAQLQVTMAEAFEYARGALGKAVECQRRNYDARAGAAELEVGDTVYYFHPLKKKGISPKLQSWWTGPWVVKTRIGTAVYEIKDGRTTKIVHHDALKKVPAEEEG